MKLIIMVDDTLSDLVTGIVISIPKLYRPNFYSIKKWATNDWEVLSKIGLLVDFV